MFINSSAFWHINPFLGKSRFLCIVSQIPRFVKFKLGRVKKPEADIAFIASLLKPRTELFTEIPEQVDFIDSLPDYDNSLYCHKKMKTNEENSLSSLKEILPVLEGVSDWTTENIHEALFALIERLGVKNGIVLWPLRVAVSGKSFTPGGGIELCYILGKEESLARIRKGIEKLS